MKTLPPKMLSSQQMLDLVIRHGAAEVAHDWDEVLATMTDDAYYEWYPLGVRISGRTALIMMWEKLLSGQGDTALEAVQSQTNREWIFDDHVLVTTEWSAQIDGQEKRTRNYSVFGFSGDRISTEITYADEMLEAGLTALFDDELLSQPGIERIPMHTTFLLPDLQDLK